MKKLIGILILIQINTFIVNATGGDDYIYDVTISIDYFERINNFYYKGFNDTLYYEIEIISKNKTEIKTNKVFATTKFGIYNINEDTITYLNFDTCSIVGFYFEQYYSETEKKIIFNVKTEYNTQIVNNFDIPFRNISNKLFILTQSYETKKYTLWTCEKDGTNLEAITELISTNNLKIDVYNTSIMTYQLFNDKIEINRWKY